METDTYKLQAIYKKRLMNARGYVMFWEIHVKKYPDELALTMLEVAKKILLKIETKIEKL